MPRHGPAYAPIAGPTSSVTDPNPCQNPIDPALPKRAAIYACEPVMASYPQSQCVTCPALPSYGSRPICAALTTYPQMLLHVWVRALGLAWGSAQRHDDGANAEETGGIPTDNMVDGIGWGCSGDRGADRIFALSARAELAALDDHARTTAPPAATATRARSKLRPVSPRATARHQFQR